MPEPGELGEADKTLLAQVEKGFETVGAELRRCACVPVAEAMRLAAEVNKYLDTSAPWFAIKTDKAAAGRAIFTALKAIDSLKVMFAPFLPFSSQRLHGFFGYAGSLFGEQTVQTVEDDLGAHNVLRYTGQPDADFWKPSALQPGQKLNQPAPLFKKLEESIVAEERARLGK